LLFEVVLNCTSGSTTAISPAAAAGGLRQVISVNLPLTFLQAFWKNAPFTKKASLGLVRQPGKGSTFTVLLPIMGKEHVASEFPS
jgi:hypothetical protein